MLDEGDPAEVLIRLAEECDADLLVIGNRGMHRRVLGSVPNTVTHQAPCSVYVVKTTLGGAQGASPSAAFRASRSARPEDHAIARGDVDEVEVDPGPGDLASQVRQHAGAVLDLDHDDLALAGDRDMGDRQRVLRGLGVRDEDVQLGPLARPDAGGRRDVHAGVADRGRHLAPARPGCSRCR